MPTARVELQGEKQLKIRLEKYENKTIRKFMRQATREIARDVQREAKALVPVDTGELERSLKVRAIKRSRAAARRDLIGHQVQAGSTAGLAGGQEFYAHFIEYGTINIDPDPFLRPALYGQTASARSKFISLMHQSLRAAEMKK